MSEIAFGGVLERLELKAGDRFVIHADRPISREHAEQLTRIWRDWVGEADAEAFPLLILDAGLQLRVIAGAPPPPEPGPPALELVCTACGARPSEGHAFGCPEASA